MLFSNQSVSSAFIPALAESAGSQSLQKRNPFMTSQSQAAFHASICRCYLCLDFIATTAQLWAVSLKSRLIPILAYAIDRLPLAAHNYSNDGQPIKACLGDSLLKPSNLLCYL
jgi:hypothetical protein